MEVPQQTLLYDPYEEMILRRWAAETVAAVGQGEGVQVLDPIRLAPGADEAPKAPADVLAQAKTPPAGPPGAPPPKGGVGTFDLIGPRGSVEFTPLPEFGAGIITANNQADLELALKIVKQLQEYLRSPEALANAPKLKIVELKYGDAVELTNLVNQLGARARGRSAARPSSNRRPAGRSCCSRSPDRTRSSCSGRRSGSRITRT
jgi:hypothetical protein